MRKQRNLPELNPAIQLIRNSPSIWIGSHIRPDGDALGSLLAMGLSLEKAGHRVAMLTPEPTPPNYRFLPGAERLLLDAPDWEAELGIVVDCDGIMRLGSLAEDFEGLPRLLDIDHHHTDHAFGDIRLIDSRAGATGELVYELIKALEIPLDPDIATCLYAAILTDTGRFTYSNTSSDTLMTACELVNEGAIPHVIARRIYEERSIEATHLLGRALSKLSSDLNGQVISAVLSAEDFAITGAAASDTEGIIDHLRAIGGPRVALLLVSPDHENVRVSLRSDGSVDVSELALRFGGGGHMMAAGCTLAGPPEEARQAILKALAEVHVGLSGDGS